MPRSSDETSRTKNGRRVSRLSSSYRYTRHGAGGAVDAPSTPLPDVDFAPWPTTASAPDVMETSGDDNALPSSPQLSSERNKNPTARCARDSCDEPLKT
jgi:hypothetical protein